MSSNLLRGIFNSDGLKKLNTGLRIKRVTALPITGICIVISSPLGPKVAATNFSVCGSTLLKLLNFPDPYNLCSADKISVPVATPEPARG